MKTKINWIKVICNSVNMHTLFFIGWWAVSRAASNSNCISKEASILFQLIALLGMQISIYFWFKVFKK